MEEKRRGGFVHPPWGEENEEMNVVFIGRKRGQKGPAQIPSWSLRRVLSDTVGLVIWVDRWSVGPDISTTGRTKEVGLKP
ncbi:hypothetical protein M0R45_031017 [Rubus argutus]|uniref:Uncharacterized protein n=1 Tax=Rubus argutus TaxID=59490 RepID=A0AAW1WF90_RUBAR